MIEEPEDPFYRPRPRRKVAPPTTEFTLFDKAPPPAGTGGGGGGGRGARPPEVPIDEEQEADHPFAIKVKVTGKGLDNDWSTAQVQVVSGTYKDYVGTNGTFDAGGVAYPDLALDVEVSKANFPSYVYLVIPIEAATETTGVKTPAGTYVKAKDGGGIELSKIPRPVWPIGFNSAVYGYCTFIEIGSWNIRKYNISPGGIPTWDLRVSIQQKTSGNVVIGDPEEEGTPESTLMRTPWSAVQATASTVDFVQPLLLTNIVTNSYASVSGTTGLALGTSTTYWLVGTFDENGEPTGWAVSTTAPSGSLITFDEEGVQTGAWYPLARVISGSHPQMSGFDFISGGSPYHLEQLCTHRLAVKAVCAGGIGAFYPVPQ